MPPADPAETQPLRNKGPNNASPSKGAQEQAVTESHNFAHAPTKSLFAAKVGSPDPLAETELPGPRASATPATPSGNASGDLELPCRFGDYDLLSQLGKGGMGVVYKAQQRSANRLVALKLIRPDQLSRYLPEERLQVLARFRNEVQAAAQLEHDHVVTVYDVGEIEGQSYYAMRLVDGESLKDRLDNGPLEPEVAARYIEQVARALAEAHARGILHRDLKPHNVMLDTKTDRALLADFGLAKLGDGDQQLTASSSALGSPPYMSPEQTLDSGKVTTASDIYGLGATLYHLLTGRPPFQAANAMATMIQVQIKDPVSPRELNPAVPLDLETICLKCLEKEPERRYASATELAEEMGRFLRGEPILARPISSAARVWRWCKRNPLVSGLATTVAASLLAGTIVAWSLASWALQQAAVAQTNALDALKSQREAERQTKLTQISEAQAIQSAKEAKRQQKLAENAALQAKRQEDRAEAKVYARTLALAQAAWHERDAPLARQYLKSSRAELRGWEYDYLRSQTTQRTLQGHIGPIFSVAFSPDGKRIASGSDQTVKVWEFNTGDVLLSLTGLNNFVTCIAFSPDGNRVAGAADGIIRIWDAKSGEFQRDFVGAGRTFAFSPDSSRIVIAFPKELRVCDVTTGEKLLDLKGQRGNVFSVAFSHDGSRIVSGGNASDHESAEMKLWNAETGKEIFTLEGHSKQVLSVAFSPDGSRIASGSTDKSVRVWDTGSGKELLTYRGHATWVTGVAFSPDGKQIVSGGGYHSPNESLLLDSPANDVLKVWDSSTGEEFFTLAGHAESVNSVAYSPDGKHLVSGSHDSTITIWNAKEGQNTPTIKSTKGESIKHMAVSSDGSKIVAGHLYGSITIWDVATREAIQPLVGHQGVVEYVTFDHQDRRVASGSRDGTITVWDVATGKVEFALQGHAGTVSCVAFSKDGSRIVSGSNDKTLKLWDASRQMAIASLTGHADEVTSVDFSSDGKLIVSGSLDRTLKLWDGLTGKEIITLTGHNGEITSVAFGLNDTRIASASRDKSVRVWDVATRTGVLALSGHTKGVASVAFSPNGLRLASGSYDGTLRVWNALLGEETLCLKVTDPELFDSVDSVAFSHNGRRIVTASREIIKIWEAGVDQ